MSDEVLLGGYRRINVVQTGQNSEIWEVVEITGNKRFALKMLLPEKVHDSDQQRMLRHEANVGLGLTHPKIIRFYKYVRHRDHPHIVMENFPAPNLKLRLMRKEHDSFIKPRLRSVLRHVCSALGFVHEKGWVHRDVKPDNILINALGDVRLIDFALAVRAKGILAGFARKGPTAGTRSYMSPEQIRSLPLDCRADIYSLGICLYELAARRLPFAAATANLLLARHISDPPPPIERDRKLTVPFETLIYQMLAKKPQDRPQTMLEVYSKIRSMRKLFTDDKETSDEAGG